jgi:lysophospholipase L1-like esterase
MTQKVTSVNRQYVSALGWNDLEFLPDGVHLTESGHARFAEHVAAALR